MEHEKLSSANSADDDDARGRRRASLSYPHSSEAHLNREGREREGDFLYRVRGRKEEEDEWLQWEEEEEEGVCCMIMRGGSERREGRRGDGRVDSLPRGAADQGKQDKLSSKTDNKRFDLSAVSHLRVHIINVHLEGPRIGEPVARCEGRTDAPTGAAVVCCDATVFSVNN